MYTYDWVKSHVTWLLSDLKDVIFSGENKFNMYGPDGFVRYLHDLSTKPRYFLPASTMVTQGWYVEQLRVALPQV